MLKSCWDCLVGYDLMREGRRSEEPYSVQLNGNVSRAPPWPTPRLSNENMFVIPKQLGEEDRITVKCETRSDPDVLRIGLITGSYTPDYNNLACQLEMFFPPNNEDKLIFRVVKDGNHTVHDGGTAADFYADTNFQMMFRIRNSEIIDIFIEDSHVRSVALEHSLDSIRFLTINGDINKVLSLNFQFG